MQLEYIFQERHCKRTNLSTEMKALVLDQIKDGGALQYTKMVLRGLEELIREEVKRLEDLAGFQNDIMRAALVVKLRI